MAKELHIVPSHHQDSGLPTSLAVPEKHFPQWLRVQAYLAKLGMWLGFAKYVLSLATIAVLTIYIGNKSTEALKDLLPIIGGICTLAGAAVAPQLIVVIDTTSPSTVWWL